MANVSDLSRRNQRAIGGLVFGATMMVLIGLWQILMAIAVIAGEAFFAVDDDYVYEWGIAAWGWIHLIVGVLVLLVGLALFSGTLWARAAGIFLALLAAIANFFFLPYYPLWSLVVIALSVFVVWSLATVLPSPGRSGPGPGA
jgi:hypothetical protein